MGPTVPVPLTNVMEDWREVSVVYEDPVTKYCGSKQSAYLLFRLSHPAAYLSHINLVPFISGSLFKVDISFATV